MKVIIFGSTGMLGSYLTSYLIDKYTVLPITRRQVDLSTISEETLMNRLYDIVGKDDIVINACGVIKQREYNTIDMIKVNSLFPNVLAKIKEGIDCKVIHITTDCVFSGSKGEYNENDKHDCLDDYGKTKSLGEHPSLTTIRTSIIGEEKSNKKSLLEWVLSNKGKTVNGYNNHLWNGVTCLELSKYVESIIKNDLWWEGVRIIHSPEPSSKYELVKMISDVYSLGITVMETNTETKCDRTLSSIYGNPITNSLLNQLIEQKKFVIK